MKINLNIKSDNYAKYAAEFLYNLTPILLKEEVKLKKIW